MTTKRKATGVKKNVFRSAYNLGDLDYSEEFTDGITEQHHTDSCDINKILAQFMETGILPESKIQNPQYGDVSDHNFQDVQNQLANAKEIHKTLPNYKARALIYQSMLLSDNIERKINLAFLLKDLFIKDKIFKVYVEELSNFLKSIDHEEIPQDYVELVNQNLDKNLTNKIKFDNEILHRSKVIKHFLDNNAKISKTEKDFKSVYKKIKKNKKYFISIKDIVVLESLVADGVSLPEDLDYSPLSTQLTVPKNLYDLVSQNQIGLVMLKIIEIIGEDKISDLDPETIYFLTKILNELDLKKIRNSILSEALPVRV